MDEVSMLSDRVDEMEGGLGGSIEQYCEDYMMNSDYVTERSLEEQIEGALNDLRQDMFDDEMGDRLTELEKLVTELRDRTARRRFFYFPLNRSDMMAKASTTPRRLAAAILLEDLDIVTDYWTERHPHLASQAEEIQQAMDDILAPFLRRLWVIRKDIQHIPNQTDIHISRPGAKK